MRKCGSKSLLLSFGLCSLCNDSETTLTTSYTFSNTGTLRFVGTLMSNCQTATVSAARQLHVSDTLCPASRITDLLSRQNWSESVGARLKNLLYETDERFSIMSQFSSWNSVVVIFPCFCDCIGVGRFRRGCCVVRRSQSWSKEHQGRFAGLRHFICSRFPLKKKTQIKVW
jgi:hypothetical protein